MPRVPVYELRARSRPVGVPNVRANAVDLSPIAEGIQQLGSVSARIEAQERERADAIAVTQAETELGREMTLRIHDDKEGLFSKRGEAAFEQEAPAFEAIESKKQELAKGLNDRQRLLFESRARGLVESQRRTAEHYIARQRDVVAADTLKARAAVAEDALAREFDNQEAREKHDAAVESAIRATAASQEGADAAVAEWRKTAAKAVLGAYIAAGRVDEAKAFLEESKGRLGADYRAMQKRVESETRATTARAEADKILAAAKDPETGLLNQGAALRALEQASPSEEVRDQVLDMVRVSELARKRIGEEKLNELHAVYERAGFDHPKLREIRDWMLDPKNGSAELWSSFRRSLAAEARARRSGGVGGGAGARRRQRDTNLELLTEFQALDDEDQLETNVDADARFAGADKVTRNRMKALQKKVREQQAKAGTPTDSEFDKFVNDSAATSPAIGKNKQALNEFKAFLRTERRKFVEQHKRDPTSEEAEKMRDAALAPQRVKRWWGLSSTEKPRFQVTPKDEVVGQEAVATPPARAPGPKVSKADRILQLKREGKTKAQALEILKAEGY